MEKLADKGDGHTAYVSDDADARKVFVDQLPQNIDLTARDAKAQVAFDPETVAQFRLIGYEDRKVADDDFRDDNVDGGEIGPGHTVTALYAVRTRPGADGHLATASVRWLDPNTRAPHEDAGQLETGALHDSLSSASPASKSPPWPPTSPTPSAHPRTARAPCPATRASANSPPAPTRWRRKRRTRTYGNSPRRSTRRTE